MAAYHRVYDYVTCGLTAPETGISSGPMRSLLSMGYLSLSPLLQIYRYVFDTTLTGKRQRVVADYIAQRGLSDAALRDEIYLQLCNLTFTRSDVASAEDGPTLGRTWQLMAHCLSCFKPSETLHNYLLK